MEIQGESCPDRWCGIAPTVSEPEQFSSAWVDWILELFQSTWRKEMPNSSDRKSSTKGGSKSSSDKQDKSGSSSNSSDKQSKGSEGSKSR